MIICTRCGHNNADDAKLCVNCQAFLEWDGTRSGADGPQPVAPGPGEPEQQPSGAPGTPRRGIHASLGGEPVAVAPGTEGATELQIRNTGTVVEELLIEVGGVPAPFAAVEPPTLSLFPGAEGSTQISFRPPRDPATPTGALPFTVTVTSSVSPDARAFLAGVVTVGGFSELTVGLVPRTATARRQTEHRLTITNAGNLPVEATVHASDPDTALDLKAAPAAIHLPAGGEGGARLRAKPRRRRWLGEPVRHPFTVEARTRDKPPLTIDGVMIQASILPRWTLRAALAAGVAIVVAGGLFAFSARGGDSSSSTLAADIRPPTSASAPLSSELPTTAPAITEPATTEAPATTAPTNGGGGATSTSEPPPQSSSSTTSSTTTATTAPAAVYAQGHLDIPQTYLADLDLGKVTQPGADIWFEAKTATDRYITPWGTQIAAVSSSRPLRDDCASAGYSTQPVPIPSLKVGSIVCVRTDQNHYSAITVAALPGPSPGTLGIDFITWK